MEFKCFRLASGVLAPVIFLVSIYHHEAINSAVLNDHLPEEPTYQDTTRTSFSVTSITSGSTATTTTAP